MQDKNNIIEEKVFMGTLKTIATAYQQISVMKMKEVRTYIEHSRTFVDRLKDVFESLKFSYPYLDLKKLRQNSAATKGTASVLITGNAKFYGDILRKIFRLFSKQINDQDTIYIIGSVGKEYMNEFNNQLKCTFIDVPDENIRIKHLLPLIQQLMQYKQVHVYYAQFKTVVEQEPKVLEISTLESLLEQGKQTKKTKAQLQQGVPIFLFEPNGEELAQFLNDNVLVSLMRQSLYDTQLARYASRIQAMNSLLNNVDDRIKALKRTELKIKRDIENKKQLERITGVIVMG